MPLLGQGVRVRHMLVRKAMVGVMVMVMVDGELWQSSRVYVLVWEVMMLHHGEPDGVVEEVMVMELVVVVSPKKRGLGGARGLGAAASEAHPAPHTPANPPPAPSGAARAARARAVRDHLVDIGVVG